MNKTHESIRTYLGRFADKFDFTDPKSHPFWNIGGWRVWVTLRRKTLVLEACPFYTRNFTITIANLSLQRFKGGPSLLEYIQEMLSDIETKGVSSGTSADGLSEEEYDALERGGFLFWEDK